MAARQRRVNGKRRTPVRRVPRTNKTGLDSSASDYAKLLADPINAPLVHPVYAGGDGGYLIRFDTTFSWAIGPTETSGYVHWTPGAMGPNGLELIAGASTGGNVAATATAIGGGVLSPGYTFLS